MGSLKFDDTHLKVQESSYRKGIALQREHYKLAKASRNFGIMRNCLENIKMEIKQQAISNNEELTLRKIENIIAWFDALPSKLSRNGPDGTYIAYPPNYDYLVNKAFTRAYELIISLLTRLDLL